jgi:hypothetical protein
MTNANEIVIWACGKCGALGKEETSGTCGSSMRAMPESVARRLFMEKHEPPTGWYDEAHLQQEWNR